MTLEEFEALKPGDLVRHANGDWHITREEALAKADEMRTKKIASMQASLKKLENLKF